MAAAAPAAVRYTEEVNRAVKELLPSDNPLDDADFDPYVLLNEQFADEHSLDSIDAYMAQIDQDIQQTNQELRETVRSQVEAGSNAERNLSEARGSIQHLFQKVEQIRSMAEESERMVKEICTEISSLDNAKRNLTDSVTTLKRLRDWGKHLEDLRQAADSQPVELDKAAGCIEAISTVIANHFKDYSSIPRIKEMMDRFEREKKLSSQIALQQLKEADFTNEDLEATSIIDACAVLEACGSEVRTAGISALVQYNIEKYQRAFPAHAEEARIEKMERRFAWFRRLMKAYDQNLHDNVPSSWCVPQELAVEYCLITRKDVDAQLQSSDLNIEIVVRILQKTLEFERDLTQRMLKLEKPGRKKYKYEGFITSCFEGMMGPYVVHEDERMRTAMNALLAEENWQNLLTSSGGESGQPVTLRAALGLFMYIRESLDKCTAFCNSSTLVSLYETWSANLMQFANELSTHIPMKTAEDTDDSNICVLINTADWSHDQCIKLAENVRAKLDDEHATKVDDEAAADQFRAVINKGVLQLIANVNKRLTPSLNQMTSTNWSATSEVGDQSPYVTTLCQVIAVQFTTLGQHIQPALFRYLCDKFITVFVPRYVSMLYKLRRLTPMACQQLLLDIQVLKAELPKVPNLGKADRFKEKELKSYSMLLKVNVGRGEAILKFVGTDVPLEGSFLAEQYLEFVGADASVSDFVKLVELKGMAPKEYRTQVEFLTKTKGLQQTSQREAASFQAPATAAETALESTKEISETLKRWKGRWGDGMSRFKDVSIPMLQRKEN